MIFKKITEENKNFEYFFNEFKNNEIIKKVDTILQIVM